MKFIIPSSRGAYCILLMAGYLSERLISHHCHHKERKPTNLYAKLHLKEVAKSKSYFFGAKKPSIKGRLMK